MKNELVSRRGDNDPRGRRYRDTAVPFFMTVIIVLDLATGIARLVRQMERERKTETERETEIERRR